MRCRPIYLFIMMCTIAGSAMSQTCDPWIVKIYKQLYGTTPASTECNIRNYNNGSWNGYDQLQSLIRGYTGNNAVNNLAQTPSVGNCSNNSYYGICRIAEFKNYHFPVSGTTCGQAAAVTALWHAGLNTKFTSSGALVKDFYSFIPPKITIAGLVEYKNTLGTDWRQLENGFNRYANMGIRYNWQKGKSALQNELRKGNPCVIMIDMGTLPPYAWGGHWVVAYGYDKTHVYVTNLGNLDNKMTWDQLHKAWGGSLTEGHLARLHGKTEMFATVWKE